MISSALAKKHFPAEKTAQPWNTLLRNLPICAHPISLAATYHATKWPLIQVDAGASTPHPHIAEHRLVVE